MTPERGTLRQQFNKHNGTLTCASSWITRYCSFQTEILETSSFLRARSFFNSGLQKVLIEFMEELSLLSLTSTSRRSISFSRSTWGGGHTGIEHKHCLAMCGMQNGFLIKVLFFGTGNMTTRRKKIPLWVGPAGQVWCCPWPASKNAAQ